MNEPKNYIGQFIGPNKIESVEVVEATTPSGKPLVRVSYKTHSTVMPIATMMLLATEKETDLNSLQDRKFAVLLPQVFAVIEEIDLTASETQTFLVRVAKIAEDKLDRALSFLWFKDDARWAPGYSSKNEMNFSEASAIIKTIPEKNG